MLQILIGIVQVINMAAGDFCLDILRCGTDIWRVIFANLSLVVHNILFKSLVYFAAIDCSSYRNAEHCLLATLTDGYQQHLRPLRNAWTGAIYTFLAHIIFDDLDPVFYQLNIASLNFHLTN